MPTNETRPKTQDPEGRSVARPRGFYALALAILALATLISEGTEGIGGSQELPAPQLGDVVSLSPDSGGASPPTPVRVYECPNLDCPVTELPNTTDFVVSAVANGDIVRGDNAWYGLGDEGRILYVPAVNIRLLGNADRQGRGDGILIAAIFVALMLTLLVLARHRAVHRMASRGGIDFDVLLASIVASAGIVLIVLSAGLGSGDESFGEIFGDSFVNLGAGFVGASVTFILFQIVLSSRGVTQHDFAELAAEVRRSQTELSGRMKELEAPLVRLADPSSPLHKDSKLFGLLPLPRRFLW